jgi:DNA-binding PadR family transcriptional regulator
MKRFAEESIGHFWSESYGQLYPTLRELETRGLIDMEVESRERGVDRKVYQLTEAGFEELRKWIARPVERRPARDEMLLKLFFGRHVAPGRLRETVKVMRAEQEKMLAALQAAETETRSQSNADPDAPYWLMTLEFGLMIGREYMRWCDLVMEKLNNLERAHNKEEAGE